MKKIITSFIVISLMAGGVAFAAKPDSTGKPGGGGSGGITGKVIALDAGHGGDNLGAQYPANSGSNGLIFEKDVNLAVVYALKAKLEAAGATVVLVRTCDESITLRQRADLATAECKAVSGHDCDAFLAVHHNGNIDATHDGTLTIYNNGGQNKAFATALHNALIASLELPDEGYLSGGYGSTIYCRFTQALSEGYYITNTDEANANLLQPEVVVCQNNGLDYSVHMGDRTNQEADALLEGFVNFFSK